MKLSIFNPILNDLPLEEMLIAIKKLGVNTLELGVGGYPGKAHANAGELIKSEKRIDSFINLLKEHDMEICALSVHGNPLHPNKAIATQFHQDYIDACVLANKLNISTLITFSGCPGDHDNAKYPNWVTCPWPEDFLNILEYQWEELTKYWEKAIKIAMDNNVNKIALEMHPGFCVYNPETLMRLRSLVGDSIGANFDPSHLIWQGIDSVAAIKHLREAIFHFHAKDTAINREMSAVNGVLDTKHYSNEFNRSWIFRTVGYGNGTSFWKDIISALQLIGYNGAISIEHEDSLMAPLEGLKKGVDFLKSIIIESEKPGSMNWA